MLPLAAWLLGMCWLAWELHVAPLRNDWDEVA